MSLETPLKVYIWVDLQIQSSWEWILTITSPSLSLTPKHITKLIASHAWSPKAHSHFLHKMASAHLLEFPALPVLSLHWKLKAWTLPPDQKITSSLWAPVIVLNISLQSTNLHGNRIHTLISRWRKGAEKEWLKIRANTKACSSWCVGVLSMFQEDCVALPSPVVYILFLGWFHSMPTAIGTRCSTALASPAFWGLPCNLHITSKASCHGLSGPLYKRFYPVIWVLVSKLSGTVL